MKEVIVLDASAFISGYEMSDPGKEHYTVPSVRDEIERDELVKIRFEVGVQTGKIRVLKPHEHYISKIRAALSRFGETGYASEADVELLALCIQLKAESKTPILLSDDYSIQNLMEHLEVQYRGMTTEGIRRRFKWSIYCPGCWRYFSEPQPSSFCPACGTKLKRKPVEKRRLRNIGRPED